MESFALESVLDANLALSLFEESNDALVIFDPRDWRILDVNPMTQRISRCRRSELVGRLVTDVFDESRLGAMTELLGAAEQTGIYHAQEGFVLRRPSDDQTVPLNLSVSRIHVEPEPLGLLTARDISDRVRAEEAMRSLQRRLERTSRQSLLSELVASIVHEIRQPLHAIGNFAEACRRAADQWPANARDISSLATHIHEASRRSSRIVDELQSLFAPATSNRELLSLNDLIVDMESLIKVEIQNDACRVLLELDDALPLVNVNRIQMQHLILNLLRNAVEAVLEADRTDRGIRIVTGVSDSGAVVTLSVIDNGPGIASDMIDELFQPFRSSHPDSIGVGLAICRRIAESHFGTLDLLATSPTGASFELRLPVASPESSPIA